MDAFQCGWGAFDGFQPQFAPFVLAFQVEGQRLENLLNSCPPLAVFELRNEGRARLPEQLGFDNVHVHLHLSFQGLLHPTLHHALRDAHIRHILGE